MRFFIATLAFTLLASAARGEPVAEASAFDGPAWSPYLVGSLIGALVCVSMLAAGKPIGASSAYASLAGLAGKATAPEATARTQYYSDNPPRFDYGIVFIAATALGAFLAAWQGGELTGQWLPDFWVAQFGPDTLWQRALLATFGGILMSFGARLAGGCTSGHGISGTLQLSVASWLALISLFVGGIAAAHLIYR